MAVVPTGAGFLVENVGVGLYRYGFNGKEKDDEGEWGSSTHYDYGFRIYNPGIARFLSVDPLAPDYPWYTPYQFAGNMPIAAIDLDGLEPYVVVAEDETEYKSSLEQPVVVVLENKFQLLQRMVMGNRFQDWQPMGCGCGLSSNV